MALRGAVFIGMLAGLACTHERPLMPEKLQETYVKDFTSSDKACTTADVNLNHSEAEAFFKRAKNIDYRTLNENYDYAPCWIEGTTMYKGESCSWKITATYTGSIKCSHAQLYFACDTCNDLFKQ